MKEEYLKYFSCPQCSGSLLVDVIEDLETKRIVRGEIICSQCKKEFPIVNYIPRFVAQADYCESFGFQWNRHRKVQIDKYNGYNFSRDRLFAATEWPWIMEGEVVLEVGSGAGRFTQILIEAGACVFSMDYSIAVDANLQNNGLPGSLCLLQGDLFQIPLKHGLFDKILCLGVLQHTPDPKQAFMSLIPFLNDGGQIVIDIYKKTISSMIQWKYLLRPILKRMRQEKLYNCIEKIVPCLLPAAILFRKIGGPVGARLLPIANYSHLGIPYEMNKEWSILDTFDMYSPKYDKPQTLSQVRRWFDKAGLEQISVRYGQNGIIGKGIKRQ